MKLICLNKLQLIKKIHLMIQNQIKIYLRGMNNRIIKIKIILIVKYMINLFLNSKSNKIFINNMMIIVEINKMIMNLIQDQFNSVKKNN